MTLFEFFTLLGGVCLFLYGMSLMSQGLKLAAGNKLRSILEHATSNRLIAVAVGILVTLLVQSSSSSVVIFQTFTVQGLIGYDMTVYLVIGAAIGSVTPNLLASLTTNRNGKRSAVLNLLFNLFRAALMLILVTVFPGFTKMIQNLTPVDLKDIAEGCSANLRVSAEKQHLSLSCRCQSAVLSADRDLVKELIENLIQNAIQYNRENGSILVRTGMKDGYPFLSVQDSGIGIPKSEQERIFERFYRIDKSRSRETGGTGLGLAIVKHIAEIHNAKISVESEPD